MRDALVFFVHTQAEYPVPLLLLFLPMLVLLGLGKSFGAPLLFWHEVSLKQLVAGLATTVLAGEVLFAQYLLTNDAELATFHGAFLVGGAFWGAFVALVSARQEVRFRRSEPLKPSDGSRISPESPGLTPPIQSAGEGARATEFVTAQVSGVPLALGALVGAAIVAALVWNRPSLERAGELVVPLFDRIGLTVTPQGNAALHGVAAWFVALFVVGVLALNRVLRLRMPALDICVVLALVVGGYGFVAYHFPLGAALAVALLLIVVAGMNRHKIRVPVLARYESNRVSYPLGGVPAAVSEAPSGSPLSTLTKQAHERFEGGGKKPLVLVSVSGGGIRAAAWASAILGRLDEHCPEFRAATRVIAGASGGMMGAATWVGSLYHASLPEGPAHPSWDDLVRKVSRESLSAVTERLVDHDLGYAFVPFTNRRDRGQALEEAWRGNLEITYPGVHGGGRPCDQDLLDVRLPELADGERRGLWPALVFSPMLVEDGRRLLMSNLDLAAVIHNEVQCLHRGAPKVASVSSVHFEELFEEAWPELTTGTAARLSAAFPYISPAAVLPVEPRRRVVDAGYYDNYGVDLVSQWLRELATHRASWLRENVSRILVVQVRDAVSPRSGEYGASARPAGAATVGLEGILGALSAVLSARESVMLFRNDAQLESVMSLYEEVTGRADFLTTTVFRFEAEASLSWYLTKAEIETILSFAAEAPSVASRLDKVRDWIAAG